MTGQALAGPRKEPRPKPGPGPGAGQPAAEPVEGEPERVPPLGGLKPGLSTARGILGHRELRALGHDGPGHDGPGHDEPAS